jgi:hypothetical protein
MLIGVDFDNSIVCYDHVFHAVAVHKGLIPPETPVTKNAVRDYLRKADREDDWTALQGSVYGVCMEDSRPFPGALEFLTRCRQRNVPAFIISHKSRYPFLGPKYDLHETSRAWLLQHGLDGDHVFLELTKQEKLRRIAALGCTHFIDDLPEFLAEPGFPAGVEAILFDPNNHHIGNRFRRANSWNEIGQFLGI